MKKVLIAMSGGVDSSVAAFLLKQQGFEVVGITMQLYSCNRVKVKSCCSAEDRLDAMRVCEKLGIPFMTVDYRNEFREKIIEPFVNEYLSGKTPSPCILCNQYFKFGALLGEMKKNGASAIATGHYARTENGKLLRGTDRKKDQSYFLFPLSSENLSQIIFPVGGLTKLEVRDIAKKEGLPTGNKSESQEICFITDDDYVSFVENFAPDKITGAGNFVDINGKILGQHRGIHAYTVGQRRGLGFGIGKRQYVIKIDAAKNEVVLGEKNDLLKKEMLVKGVHWISESFLRPTTDPSTSSGHSNRRPTEVQIRSTHTAASAHLEILDEKTVKVTFEKPQLMITPGQAAVFYDGDEVLGGGWIAQCPIS